MGTRHENDRQQIHEEILSKQPAQITHMLAGKPWEKDFMMRAQQTCELLGQNSLPKQLCCQCYLTYQH
jgi:hypothetical protein